MNKELHAIVMPNGRVQFEWKDVEQAISKPQKIAQEEVYKRANAGFGSVLLFLAFCDRTIPLSNSLEFWRNFAYVFADKLIHTPDLENKRKCITITPDKEQFAGILNSAPFMPGEAYLSAELLDRAWQQLNHTFQEEVNTYKGSLEEFFKSRSYEDVHLVGRVYFHLVERKEDKYPFAFLATYTTSLNKNGKIKHLPLKCALEKYGANSKNLFDLLSTVSLAANKSVLISNLLETGELFHPLAWDEQQAYKFLKENSLYDESGIICRIPDWWKGNKAQSKLEIRVGDSQPSFVGMDAIINCDINLYVNGVYVSEEEIRRLLQETEGLAYIKNKWVTVDHKKLQQTLDAYEKALKLTEQGGMSLREALRMQLNPNAIMGTISEDSQISVLHGDWLSSVVRKLQNPHLIKSRNPGEQFKAELRPYQQKGLNWLSFLHSLGLGACLADDMGLGKTVQVLAFLNSLCAENLCKANLLIIPASLIGNWTQEINRFTPAMKYFVAHPSYHAGKKVDRIDQGALDNLDLVITTYALVQKYDWIKEYTWQYVILDEAQAIKNPGTKQTRSVKKLKAGNRIILTGTPFENRLSDVWSLFDFLNAGLLGNIKEFKHFSKSLSTDSSGYARLRNTIHPYMLRRLKTDRSIIDDLPDKVEMKTYCMLTKKQILLYRKMVDDLAETIENVEGIKRKGIVLASLTKFKQLCNHPDQYLGTGNYEEKDSGKFIRLKEVCETIREKQESLLVFTQFKEITEPLKDFLDGIFQREGLVLHGSIPVRKRKEIIAEFQGDEYVPFMVLSLKAGGVGLNLTKANHVFHFDRWWNPAVENQATDRAFRIGQNKNVLVHKCITKGTIEERIDDMLQQKTLLSQEIISDNSGAWITELDNRKLLDLFAFSM